jgi:hypothetical protein
MPDDTKYLIWSNESSFALFLASGRIYVCRTPKEAYNTECLFATGKHGGGSVTISAATSWYSAGITSIIIPNGRIAVSDCVDILGSQVRPNNDAVLQDDISPMHTARSVHFWFEEHEDTLQHLWPAQSPDLNIIEPLLSVMESRVRSRIPPPTSLKQPRMCSS